MRILPQQPRTQLLFASLVIATCLVGIGLAVGSAQTGTDRYNLPDAIERIDPVRSATQVPSQSSVFVDLEAGYRGVLVIDGLELETVDLDDLKDATNPGKQITLPPTTVYEKGNATLTFDPAPGSSITEFSQGEHIVKVIYWKIIEGQSRARSYTWTFTVF
ncbi:MAG: hypothetical protein Q7V88_00520 [Actinomycetota bacterium]|nr:hypothetical protein [Actinomycetota bacterium]